jgi:ADP-ribose pyrophosphatase YjhB (NUDIX family)
MKYCSECGSPIEKKELPDDPVPRYHCDSCKTTHYQNPIILVSCFAIWQDKALWIKRKTEPFAGLWAVPSGFMEENETPQQAAAREVFEETRARVNLAEMELHTVGTLVDINQIYLVFRAPLLEPFFSTTEEAEEVQLFSADEVPYSEFAYPDVSGNVSEFYDELAAGKFNVHLGVLVNGVNTVNVVRREYP